MLLLRNLQLCSQKSELPNGSLRHHLRINKGEESNSGHQNIRVLRNIMQLPENQIQVTLEAISRPKRESKFTTYSYREKQRQAPYTMITMCLKIGGNYLRLTFAGACFKRFNAYFWYLYELRSFIADTCMRQTSLGHRVIEGIRK